MLRFEVIESDIADNENCPIGIAINRHLDYAYYVSVSLSKVSIRARLRHPGMIDLYSVQTPLSIASFIRLFNNGEKVTAGWHEIDIPSQYLQSV